MTPWSSYVVLAAVALVCLAAAACGGGADSEPRRTVAPNATRTVAPDLVAAGIRDLPIPLDLAEGTALGRTGAPVTLAVYEDFQCPFCLRFTALIEPTIVTEYVVTGKVRLEFHYFPVLGDESVAAAVAAECAAQQDRFWPFHRALFQVQADAGQHRQERTNAGRFSLEALRGLAAATGLGAGLFSECLAATAALDVVRADFEAATALGLRGTPGFVVNGEALSGAPATIADWRKLLDDAVAKAPN